MPRPMVTSHRTSADTRSTMVLSFDMGFLRHTMWGEQTRLLPLLRRGPEQVARGREMRISCTYTCVLAPSPETEPCLRRGGAKEVRLYPSQFQLLGQVARCVVIRFDLAKLRRLLTADVLRVPAARMEVAAARRIGGVGHLSPS